jgi:hypothetical protein
MNNAGREGKGRRVVAHALERFGLQSIELGAHLAQQVVAMDLALQKAVEMFLAPPGVPHHRLRESLFHRTGAHLFHHKSDHLSTPHR